MRELGAEAQETIDVVKIELCLALDRVINRNQWSYAVAAAWMGTSKANVSYVATKRIEKLSVSQLIKYLAMICPNFRFMISIDSSLSAGRPQLMERPPLKINASSKPE